MLDQKQIEQLLFTHLQDLEGERVQLHKQLKNRTLKADGSFILLLVLSFVVFFYSEAAGENRQLIVFLSSIGLFIIFMVVLFYRQGVKGKKEAAKNSFEERVKTEVYQEVFKTWNNSVAYHPDRCVEEQHFEKAGLHKNYTIYSGDDLCKGQLEDGRTFQFSELVAQRKVQEYSADSAYHTTHKIPVFKGLFFVLDNTLPFKGFKGDLHIYPTVQERTSNTKKKKPKPTPKQSTSAQYNDGILDAGFAESISNQAPTTPKKPLPSLFDRAYTIDGFGDQSIREKLPLEFCQQLGYLRSFFQQQFAISFHDNKAYFSSRHQLDFWPVTLEHSLLSEARIKHIAWNFRMVFLLLDKVTTITYPDLSATS